MVDPATPYAARLQAAMRRAGRDPDSSSDAAWLAEQLGFSYQAARKAISGATKMLRSDNNTKAARALNVHPDWLATGEDSHWTPSQHAATGVIVSTVAQGLIQPQPDDEPAKPAWEFIVSAPASDLPKRFSLPMPDDALAPSTPRGTLLLFETAAAPVFGHGVLVEDNAGQRYVRKYAQGPGGRWLAVANNAAYLSLDSADGVRVLAAVTWRATGEV